MNVGERTDFELKMTADSNFKLVVEDVKTILLGIESAALKENMGGFHNEMTPVRSLNTEKSISL